MRGFVLFIFLIVACDTPPSAPTEPEGDGRSVPEANGPVACQSLYAHVCESTLPLEKFVSLGKARAQELAIAARKNHFGDYAGLVQEVETAVRTELQVTRKDLSAIFENTRQQLLRVIQGSGLSSGAKYWAMERIKTIKFWSTADLIRVYGNDRHHANNIVRYCGGDTLGKANAALLVDNALTSGVVLVCPALYLVLNTYRDESGERALESGLTWLFAHEMSHLLDPLVAPGGIDYSSYFECLFAEKKVPSEQWGEVVADYWANQAFLHHLKQANATPTENYARFRQAHFLRCGFQDPSKLDNVHPPAQYRLNSVATGLGLYPEVFACQSRVQCCSLNGPC